jgi:hypothetical protein
MPKVMAGMSVFSPARLIMALVVTAVLACRAVATPPDAGETLRRIEKQVVEDLRAHVAWLPFSHKLEAQLAADGSLRVYIEVRTRELKLHSDAEELARLTTRKLLDHLAVRWPRLALARESRLQVKRPFSFTEDLPDYAAPLALPPPKRTLSVRPPPSGARITSAHGALDIGGPNRTETDIRIRISRTFSRRWIIKTLAVGVPSPRIANVTMRVDMVSQGDKKDRVRLVRATVELEQVLKISGHTPADGSELRADVFDGERGARIGKLVATYKNGWSIVGEVPATVSTGPAKSIASQPRPEAKAAIAASLHDRHVKRAKHPPPPPEPDPEMSGAHRPVSTEDLVEVPGSIVGPRGLAKFRTRILGRRVKPGPYSNLGETETVNVGTAISIVTARHLQTTFAYTHLDQRMDLPGGLETEAAGDSLTFSLKYQTPPALIRNAHLAVGTDVLLQSRRDESLRLPDDYEQSDSFWVTYNMWTSPISLVHLMVRRIGIFRLPREFTQFALAQELLAHHPFRRAYWEIVYDDRGGKVFPVAGRARSAGVAVNAGVEFALGKRSGLLFNVPHLLDDRYREANVTLFTRL